MTVELDSVSGFKNGPLVADLSQFLFKRNLKGELKFYFHSDLIGKFFGRETKTRKTRLFWSKKFQKIDWDSLNVSFLSLPSLSSLSFSSCSRFSCWKNLIEWTKTVTLKKIASSAWIGNMSRLVETRHQTLTVKDVLKN